MYYFYKGSFFFFLLNGTITKENEVNQNIENKQ